MRYMLGFVVGGSMVMTAFITGMIGGYAVAKCNYESKKTGEEE